MSQVKGRAWTIAKPYDGIPKLSDFKMVEETYNPAQLKNGEILTEALYFTVDPYMRNARTPPGGVVVGEQVARVKESKNPKYPVGSMVQFYHGWRTAAVVSPDMEEAASIYGGVMLQRVPELGGLSPSLALGVVGMPGLTAYIGMEVKAKPQKGEIVVVSGAAGAVGSLAGQLAKLHGCTVIGSAGSEDKCKLLKSWGFDHVFNYKKTTVEEALNQYAPDGVDLYFDNVGGEFSWAVLQRLKRGGRAVICGAISQYNGPSKTFPNYLGQMNFHNQTYYGLFAWDYFKTWPQYQAQLVKLVKEGKIKFTESLFQGFEKMPEAFISLFTGTNVGKVIIKV